MTRCLADVLKRNQQSKPQQPTPRNVILVSVYNKSYTNYIILDFMCVSSPIPIIPKFALCILILLFDVAGLAFGCKQIYALCFDYISDVKTPQIERFLVIRY